MHEYHTRHKFIVCLFHSKLADFGVSAKNKYTMQKRDSFIGTPYWYVNGECFVMIKEA